MTVPFGGAFFVTQNATATGLKATMKPLTIAGRQFSSRLFLGTGKFSSGEALKSAIAASGTQIVTFSLKRVELGKPREDSILSAIDTGKIIPLLNTSGAREAAEAVRIAELGRAAGYNWIKLEIHPDPNYLLPDPIETLKAAKDLVERGFVVLPYINADPVLAKRLEDVGAHAVMPLGSPIGTNLGLKTEYMLRIIIEQSKVPVVVDAGLGLPSHAAAAIELGADAVLVNTAVAAAGDPAVMAKAFSMAVKAAEMAMGAKPANPVPLASPTSPDDIFSGVLES